MTGKTPDDRKYTASHEWVKAEGGELLVGITDHAQSELTDIVFVELPAVGKTVAAKQGVLVLESVKTVADVYAPAPGTVVAANEELKKHPEWINRDPYGKGWLYRLKPSGDAVGLISASEYAQQVGSGASH